MFSSTENCVLIIYFLFCCSTLHVIAHKAAVSFFYILLLQNVKGVFDAAIKVVLQPPKAKKKKGKAACSIL